MVITQIFLITYLAPNFFDIDIDNLRSPTNSKNILPTSY